ncbi:MAG TPA: MarR family transcriptional regulator [Candidatus Limnocylindrales bacterium]|nr:MarR family transcriptional regulator [Candidatus Limnocylindrales bacterium]
MNDIDRACQAVRTATYDEALADRLGLNPTDLRCLELVIAEPGITAGRLAERADLTTGAVTGVVDRLERTGFVRRQPDPADRRSVTIAPVEERLGEYRSAVTPLQRAIEAILEEVPAVSRSAVANFLDAAVLAVEGQTARLRARARGGFVGNAYSAPLGDVRRARLVFASGAPRLSFNFSPLGPRANARLIMETAASRLRFEGPAPAGELVRATFDGPQPDVRASGGVVTIRYKREALAAFSGRGARIELATGIPWTIEIDGGITDLAGSLARIELEGLDIGGGANHVSLDLPVPSGSVPVRLHGVASDVRFRRPAATPAALTVDGGIAKLRLDNQKHHNVGGRHRFQTDGFTAAPDRYEVEVLGGASQVRVETR